MSFKVGDRVEVLTPPPNTENQKDQIGPGEIIGFDPQGGYGETYQVQLDSGEDWFYSADQLRPLGTTKPSIRVGDQVRLTGVVQEHDHIPMALANVAAVAITGWVDGGEGLAWVEYQALEVIRQPFKRGEVVHLRGSTVLDPAMVLEDESDGKIVVISLHNVEGQHPMRALASDFERRP